MNPIKAEASTAWTGPLLMNGNNHQQHQQQHLNNHFTGNISGNISGHSATSNNAPSVGMTSPTMQVPRPGTCDDAARDERTSRIRDTNNDHDHPVSLNDNALLLWRQFVQKTRIVLQSMPSSWSELNRVRWMNERASPKTAYVPTDVSRNCAQCLSVHPANSSPNSRSYTDRTHSQRYHARDLGGAGVFRSAGAAVAQRNQRPAARCPRVRRFAGAAVPRLDGLPLCVLLQSQSSAEGHSAPVRSRHDLHLHCGLVLSVADAQHADRFAGATIRCEMVDVAAGRVWDFVPAGINTKI